MSSTEPAAKTGAGSARAIPDEQIEALARTYTDFDKGFNRTKSRAAVDGGVLLLALLDELKAIRETLDRQTVKGRR